MKNAIKPTLIALTMAFVTRTAVLDAMNQGMTEMLKKYSALVELNFLTKPHYVKI